MLKFDFILLKCIILGMRWKKLTKDIKGLKESLIYGINTSDKVIIIPHVNPDFDAIGSALGLAVIAKKYKKDVYIIVDEPSYKLYKGVSDILKDIKNEFKVISGAEYKTIKGDNDLFILTDVNGKNRIPLKDEIVDNKTIVIDHHDENDDTIEGFYNYMSMLDHISYTPIFQI